MNAAANINDILSQVNQLDKAEQLSLLQQLTQLLKRNGNEKKTSLRLTALAGLGSEVWKDTDIDQYINEERQW